MTIFEKSLEALKQLRPDVQPQAIAWLNRCWALNLPFQVLEVYRSPERQAVLYKIGRRGKPNEDKVTWTLNSYHTMRLACDIDPLEMASYAEIEEVGQQYGIYRPIETLKKGDWGHFQFDRVKPLKPKISPAARLKGLKNRLASTKNNDLKPLLKGQIQRLQERLGVM